MAQAVQFMMIATDPNVFKQTQNDRRRLSELLSIVLSPTLSGSNDFAESIILVGREIMFRRNTHLHDNFLPKQGKPWPYQAPGHWIPPGRWLPRLWGCSGVPGVAQLTPGTGITHEYCCRLYIHPLTQSFGRRNIHIPYQQKALNQIYKTQNQDG
jgi:hypothetical protein